MRFLGVDTSNYTTSLALYDDATGKIIQKRQMLPVGPGKLGLRQSDAVFMHVKQLPGLVEELLEGEAPIECVGVSVRPRDAEGSYMPCFLPGELTARSISAAMQAPLFEFSHQAGHIAAALYGADKLEMAQRPFLAFHVSGGTTECLAVTPGENKPFEIEILAETLDLNAGQVIDRVGAMLDMRFPSGPALEKLAGESNRMYKPKPVLKGLDCCLSGVENQCRAMLDQGTEPADIACYCQGFIAETIYLIAKQVQVLHPGLPFVFAGGVISNVYIRKVLSSLENILYAPPQFSSDNAVGTAVLASLSRKRFTIC